MSEVCTSINPARIQWCCDQVGMSLDDLVQRIGLPEKETLFSGELTYRQLDEVGEYFGYDTHFFSPESERSERDYHSNNYRALVGMAGVPSIELTKIIKQVEKRQELHLLLIEEHEVPLEKIALPNLKSLPDWAAKGIAVREWLGFESLGGAVSKLRSFEDYREALEQKGFMVFVSLPSERKWRLTLDRERSSPWHVPNESALGFCIPHQHMPIIFVKHTNPKLQTFTLFHQLAHLLLHNECHLDSAEQLSAQASEQKNIEANSLAGACLLPGEYTREVATKSQAEAASEPAQPRYLDPLTIYGWRFVNRVINDSNEMDATFLRAAQTLDNLLWDDYILLEEHIFRKPAV